MKLDCHPVPNVRGWMAALRALPEWKTTNVATDAVAASPRGKPLVTV